MSDAYGIPRSEDRIYPPSNLLMGVAGSGKTTALATYVECGIRLRMLATEPNAPARVITTLKEKKLPLEMFDWCYVSPAPPKWDSLITSAKLIGTMNFKDIAGLRSGIAKPDMTQWISFLEAIANFKSARTGELLGDATEWDDKTAFVIDGLTGVNFMSRALTVGLKPNPDPGEWGIMQNNILDVLRKLASDSKCFFNLIAHVERETNEVSGNMNLTVSTLGSKLAPKLPPQFTNVIYAKRVGTVFNWSVAEANVDTKNSDLELKADLPPSFKPIVDAYRARIATLDGTGTSTVVHLPPRN